jgi:hypothetical protein
MAKMFTVIPTSNEYRMVENTIYCDEFSGKALIL